MATQYTIYLVNNSANTALFWCFLAPPDEIASDPNVFANSSTSLAVAPMAPGVNTFTIPVQYMVGAGASNSAVGLNIRVDSSITQNTDLAQAWEASYATVPPNMGPTLKRSGAAPTGKISIKANAFNQGNNEANGWFSNMSYGIKTSQGFIGMSWSPPPQMTRTLTPKLEFYIATGSFGSNALANWTEVSNGNQRLTLADFQLNKSTVIYTEIGGWEVRPGAPPPMAIASRGTGVSSLLHSHQLLAEAHAKLVGCSPCSAARGGDAVDEARQLGDGTQSDTLATVEWDDASPTTDASGDTILSGTLSVSTALTTAFAAFIVSGIRCAVTWTSASGLSIAFSYRGTDSANFVKSLFYIGARLLFVNRQGAL